MQKHLDIGIYIYIYTSQYTHFPNQLILLIYIYIYIYWHWCLWDFCIFARDDLRYYFLLNFKRIQADVHLRFRLRYWDILSVPSSPQEMANIKHSDRRLLSETPKAFYISNSDWSSLTSHLGLCTTSPSPERSPDKTAERWLM